ncbi:hypothetical protein [Campylobacter sp. CCUG 57310]|uniref:hypothetical protein n=1 Tax=Campylobacter sp. CCUG 57310 TaxID=2517362 RepID=UPI0015646B20|nr:hypothetical protein [Campylobacter sp. CCUG 57310]QKF93204.1 hypothetical protein CORI_a018 [Campylobacter sp. CCUG 57310]
MRDFTSLNNELSINLLELFRYEIIILGVVLSVILILYLLKKWDIAFYTLTATSLITCSVFFGKLYLAFEKINLDFPTDYIIIYFFTIAGIFLLVRWYQASNRALQ